MDEEEVEEEIEEVTVYYGILPAKRNSSLFSTKNVEILNHQHTLLQNISKFYDNEALSDIRLIVNGATYYGHRFVLAKSSDVFETMLYSELWPVGETLELHEATECADVFDKFLRYFYTHSLIFDLDSSIGLYLLSDKYNVSSLKTSVVEFMVQNCRLPHLNNAINLMSWANDMGLTILKNHCVETVVRNMDVFIRTKEWRETDIDIVVEILKDPKMIVNNEFAIYAAVSEWLLHENHSFDLRVNSQLLLPLVRFSRMSREDWLRVENSFLMSRIECQSLLVSTLNVIYRHYVFSPLHSPFKFSFKEDSGLLRYYYEDRLCEIRDFSTFFSKSTMSTCVNSHKTYYENRWKITFNVHKNNLSIFIRCIDTVYKENESIQACLVAKGREDTVVKVEDSQTFVGRPYAFYRHTFDLSQLLNAVNLNLLVKYDCVCSNS